MSPSYKSLHWHFSGPTVWGMGWSAWLALQTYYEAFTIGHTNTIPQCRSACVLKCQSKAYMGGNYRHKSARVEFHPMILKLFQGINLQDGITKSEEPLSFRTGGGVEKMKGFRRGSKGLTSHYIIQKAQTTDEVRYWRLYNGHLKLLTDQKFVVVIKKSTT